MARRFYFVVAVFVIIIVGLITYILYTYSNKTDNANVPGISYAFVDRCTIVPADLIKQTTNLTVLKKSGSADTCIYEVTGTSGKISVTVYFGDSNLLYNRSSFANSVDLAEHNINGFYSIENSEKATIRINKNNKLLIIQTEVALNEAQILELAVKSAENL